MKLRNYTSKVPAADSINFIERLLVKSGCQSITKVWSPDARLDAIHFQMVTRGTTIPVRLPANIVAIERTLLAEKKRITDTNTLEAKKQAERTAWKVLAEWVQINLQLVELEQMELLEMFLPYVYDQSTQRTFYTALKEKGFKPMAGVLQLEYGKD